MQQQANSCDPDCKNDGFPFDYIAQNIFYPIYSVIAEDILLGINSMEGRMIDIGCGGGHLGLAVMERTRHRGYFMDINQTALNIAKNRARERGLYDRAEFCLQDVHDMHFPDNFANLIISRGSFSFWRNLERALLEIYRVLAPGGKTYVGGGMGNSALEASIRIKMQELDPSWPDSIRARSHRLPTGKLKSLLHSHGIHHEIVENSGQGRWVIMHKE